MDAGASYPSGILKQFYRKRSVIDHDKRYFCKTPSTAPVQSSQKHAGCDERGRYSLTSLRAF